MDCDEGERKMGREKFRAEPIGWYGLGRGRTVLDSCTGDWGLGRVQS
jgi:hypothetical protein